MTLPISRTVNVTVSKNTGFAARRGFGVPLFLTSTAVAGELDADNLTKAYGSLDEVAVDFAASTEFFQAAQAAFSQNPRPLQIKAGFYDRSAGEPSETDIQDAINAIADVDSEFYFLTVESLLRDTPAADGLIAWVESQNKMLFLDSNDNRHEDASDTANVSARHKGTVQRTAVFYHNDATTYPAFAFAASAGTRNFDDANTAYTAKFKSIQGLSTVDVGSAAVQAITGFVPQIGQDVESGHLANTYVNIGGSNFVVEGSTLTPNVFIDEIHASDWVQLRTEEEMLNILTGNERVALTEQGMNLLASGPRQVESIARQAGIVAEDLNPETGDFESSFIITVPSVFDVPESQRRARIAPAIRVDFRYAGAVHYSTVNYSITF